MMMEAGFDPATAAQALAWLNNVTGRSPEQTNGAGTHPGFRDRIEAVNAAYAGFTARGLPMRIWYFKDGQESNGVVVTPSKLAEVRDAWILTLVVDNSTEATATIFAGSVLLADSDGDLAIRFLRSTLPGDVDPQGKIERTLTFAKRSRTPPTALLLPVLFPDRRIDVTVALANGGPYTPGAASTPLPAPPPFP